MGFVGGTPGDPSPLTDWWDYILNLSVTVSIDGSSGNITLDKFGFAGQDAVTTQSVGAITLTATGGEGTVAGSIFQGLALGLGENANSDGATWNIPLIGLEKKLDDIALINVPFLDGEDLDDAIDFLARYAGILTDLANAPNAATIQLQTSEDVNVARYDWKSGTSVRTALDEALSSRLHGYVIRDGKIFVYEKNVSGLPVTLGPDREPLYPDTKYMNYDQTPDFEDIRNEIVVIGLQAITGGQGTNQAVPTIPRIKTLSSVTIPDIPWAKSVVQPLSGVLSLAEVREQAEANQAESIVYGLIGRVSIPGNADIKPYDQWGGLVIFSVTHNMDFQSKSWTTDLELGSKTT